MVDTNIGFDVNAGIGEADFSLLSSHLGSALAVVDTESSRRVSVGTNAMTVDVAAGTSYAFGERNTTDTVVNKTISPVSLAGATRWDAIVLRRTWSNNQVNVVVIPGTASIGAPEVAPTLTTSPGDTYDQLLALIKATNGSTALLVSDKRIWASKLFSVATPSALPPASAALYGATCYVISTRTVYRCLLASGSPGWIAEAPAKTVLTGKDVISAATGWTVGQATGSTVLLPCRGLYDAKSGDVQVDLQMRRQTGTISPSSNSGNITDTPIGTLDPTLCPDADVVPMPFSAQYSTGSGSANSWLACQVTLSATGVLTLVQLNYNNDLVAITSGQSFRAHLTFSKRT